MKIVIVLRHHYHCEHVRTVLTQNGYDYPVYEFPDIDLVSRINKLAEEGVHVIITGTVYANILMDKVALTVSPIRRSKLPFSITIRKALLQSKKVAVVWRENDSDTAFKPCQEFDKNVKLFTYNNPDEIEEILNQISIEGYRTIVGPYLINKFAHPFNFNIFNIPYDDDDILAAIRIAEHNLRAIEERQQYTETLKIIQDNISEGIVVLGPAGKIQMMNRIAEKIMHVDSNIWVGLPLSRTELSCPETNDLTERFESFNNKILHLHGSPVAMDGRPVFVNHTFKSAIITLTLIEQLQKNEQDIRAKMNIHNFIASASFDKIIGDSPALHSSIKIAKQYASVDSSVLVYGESGTGKEMFVQSIHNESKRRKSPFVVINCAALPENLIESELFGYEKGSFTGALSNGKQGLFEKGHQGTVFLDEISEMPLHVQARFLRVLQERVVTPIGGQRVIPVDIRVIAATNRNLLEMVRENKFREDLYYRISVLTLSIPSLRERVDDIEPLAKHFVRAKSTSLSTSITGISKDAIEYLKSLNYPGNIRQFSNIIERAMVLCEESILDVKTIVKATTPMGTKTGKQDNSNGFDAINLLKEENIRRLLLENNNSRIKTAEALGISTSTLYRRMKDFNIIP